MSSDLLLTLIVILGAGLAVLSAACLVLWRRVRVLNPPGRLAPPVAPPAIGPGPLPPVPRGPAPRARDEVARRLDELADRHRTLEARLARIEAAAAQATMATLTRPSASGTIRRVDRGGSMNSGGPTLISVPDLATPPASSSEAAAQLDRRFGSVWAMADAGMPPEALGRETGHPIGQVELILGLRRRLPAAGAGPDA